MEHLNKRKPNLLFFWFLLPFVVYGGYAIGKMEGEQISIDNVRAVLLYSLTHPWPPRFTMLTAKAILILFLAWIFSVIWYVGNYRSLIPGLEYGSAKFADPKQVNERLEDPDETKNKILSENIRMSIDTRRTGLNNNVTVIGGSGSGKSFHYVMPNGMKGDTSMVLTDPKGELYHKLGNILELKGYRVIAFNLVDMDNSDCYNPFEYIRSDNDIIKLVTNMMKNTSPKGASSSDPFWDNALSLYLQAIMSYVWYECPKHGKKANIREMMDLLTKAKVAEKEGLMSDLDMMMDVLPDDHPAKVAYLKVRSGAKDTIRSIIISAHARFAYLQNPKVLRILDRDDMNIRALGEGVYENPDRKTALFCIIPDNDKSYNFLVGVLYSQIFQELYYIADFQYGGALPVHVAFWMDEFPNVALPDGFTEIISTMRSRNISCNVILQNRAQLQALFKDSWQAIIGNTDALIYLGGNEPETHKYMTEMLGKYTVGKQSKGESAGKSGSSSSNYDVIGRDLLTPDEVRKMDNSKCLIFIRGFDPIMDDKFHTLESDEFALSTSLGMYDGKKETEEAYEEEQVHFYIDAEGENALENSYRYQTENYFGVFKESNVFSHLAETAEGYYTVPFEYGGYMLRYETGQSEVFPAFDPFGETRIHAGGAVLKKLPICGYYEDEMFTAITESEAEDLFIQLNRMTPAKRNLL